MIRKFVTLMFIFIVIIIGIMPAQATNATVTNCTDFTGGNTIHAAVTATNMSGGTITFDCDGTITFTSHLTITANVTITANGRNVIFDGGGLTRFFVVNSGVSLTLNGFTLRNGNSAFSVGGAIDNDGTLSISYSTFTNNSATFGGAIDNDGSVSISYSTFTDNSAAEDGGAIDNDGTLSISYSTFTNNSATSGGAVDNDGIVSISHSTFTNNSVVVGGGGAIFNFRTLSISHSTFTNNRATWDGGAIYNFGGTVSISDSTFTNNSAASSGGAIDNNSGGTLDISDSTFTNNSAASSGGAIDNNSGGTLDISNSTFTNNSATTSGGAIYNFDTASSENTHYENNTCTENLITDNGGNTVINALGCPGIAPINLDVSPLSCVGDNATFTINAGDNNFDITGTGGGLPLADVSAGTITLTGPSTWTNITITERRGDRQSVNLGGIDCVTEVIIPPIAPIISLPIIPLPIIPPVAPVSAVTVLGCALDLTDGLEIANAPDNTYCRVLMRNGGVVGYSGAIPRNLIALGVILAVDVYRLEGGRSINTFPNYARVCLAGAGRLFYMDSRNAPRVTIELQSENVDGLTCGWIPAPGTLILTN